MPFCRECGKGVEEDWVTCPFCSQPIGPPAARVAEISDSVVMGNVNVNDSKSISTAVKSASTCPICGSIGTTQISCRECESIAYCNICEDEVRQKITDKVKFTFTYFDYDESLTTSKGSGYKCAITDSRICYDCVIEFDECLCCENKFKSESTTKEREKRIQDAKYTIELYDNLNLKRDNERYKTLNDYNRQHEKHHQFLDSKSWLSPKLICDVCFGFHCNPPKISDWFKRAKKYQTLSEFK
tara:strand:- start:233 stop:958 length:726 start_codon:yes stop_codon:yes gene_type:complete